MGTPTLGSGGGRAGKGNEAQRGMGLYKCHKQSDRGQEWYLLVLQTQFEAWPGENLEGHLLSSISGHLSAVAGLKSHF